MRKLIAFFVLFPICSFGQPEAQWHKAVKNGIQTINSASTMCVDKLNNCFIIGTTCERDSAKKILVLKTDAKGIDIWKRVYQDVNKSDVLPVAACSDANGNVIITGVVKKGAGNTDILTLKYSDEGILLWEQVYSGKSELYDLPTAITTDKKGYVLVSGHETISEANLDLILLRYSPAGMITWTRNFSTPHMDVATDVVTDDSCNIYLCGNINSSIRSGDIVIMKYDSSGHARWNYVYDGVENAVDMASDIVLDDSANIYVTGMVNHSNERSDVPLLKLNRNGKFISEYLFAEDITDAMGNDLVITKKNILLHATFQDYLQNTFSNYIFITDKQCKLKYKFKSPSPDITYLYAAEGAKGSNVLLGYSLVRPENTITPYIEIRDSLHKTKYEYKDSVLTSLIRLKDIFMNGKDIYFLGDDATETVGTISIAKFSVPEEIKRKPIPTPHKKPE